MENKRNYQRELDELIKKITDTGKRPALLLHSCCGPCSSYVLEYLNKFFDIKLFFYNPNIHPYEEYIRRLEAQKKVLESLPLKNVELIVGEYDKDRYFEMVKGLENEPEGGKRCEVCIRMRMERAAEEAEKQKTDYFATTLTVSPHKNAPYINRTGEIIQQTVTVPYLVSDFKKKNGYKRSVELCRIYDIYRQNYCGCKFSIWEEQGNE